MCCAPQFRDKFDMAARLELLGISSLFDPLLAPELIEKSGNKTFIIRRFSEVSVVVWLLYGLFKV